VTQFPPWILTARVYHNCSSKDLVRRHRISYDLSLHLSPRIGVSFSRLRRSAGSYSTSCGRPSMCITSMRKHPRDFCDVSVNHSRTERKAIDNTQGRASRLSSSGVPFAGLQPSPAAALGLRFSPRSEKDDSTCPRRTRALELSPCNAGSRCGTLERRAEPRAPPEVSSIAAMYPVAGQRYWRQLAVRSRIAPTRRRRWPDSKNELHR